VICFTTTHGVTCSVYEVRVSLQLVTPNVYKMPPKSNRRQPDSASEPQPQLSASAGYVNIKLPQFSTQEPLSWFRRAETTFRLRNITDSCTQADYVLEAIPDGIFADVAAWLDDQPDQILYASIKAFLLKEYTLNASARAQRLLQFPQKPLGDRTAHAVWNEMQAIARLPETDPETGLHRKVDLMRELWLQTLPPPVRAALTDADTLPMKDLVQKADDLINATRAAQKPPAATFACLDDTDINAVHQRQTSRPSRPGPKPVFRGRLLPSGFCTYHTKFEDAARNCIPGCQ